MEKDANYFLVGLFVSLCLLALVGFFIWMAGPHDTGDYDRYTVYFTDPVSGLNEEASVKYKGVQVGKVLDTRISEDRNDLIKVDIEVKKGTPIHAQTKAEITSQGIAGTNYIELATEAGDKAPPQRIAEENYPVLKGTGSSFAKFVDDMPKISKQLTTTLTALDDLSRGGVKMMESIDALAEKLKEDPSRILYPPKRGGVEIPK